LRIEPTSGRNPFQAKGALCRAALGKARKPNAGRLVPLGKLTAGPDDIPGVELASQGGLAEGAVPDVIGDESEAT
jgi:hypothetical protein